MDYGKICGHEPIIDHLQIAVCTNNVNHAYIFHGVDGSGKRMIANAFSKHLLCESGTDKDKQLVACNQCKSCKQVESNNHPDIIYVTHEKASIGVEDIRVQLNNDVTIKPYSSKYKVYIIDEAEKMTEGAQNALLKTIEEPPQYAVILLLVNNIMSLLPTILSRCIQLNLRPISNVKMEQLLMEQYHIPDYLAKMSASFAGGIVGRAIDFATSESFRRIKSEVIYHLSHIKEQQMHELIDQVKAIAKEKENLDYYLDLMIVWYRDVLVYKATKEQSAIMFKEEYQTLKKCSDELSYEQVDCNLKAIETAKKRLKANVNFDIAIEMMLLTIKENGNDKCNRC